MEKKKKQYINRLKAALNANRRNQEIVKIYNEWKPTGLSDTFIHQKYIYPKFFISLITLRGILGKRLQKEKQEINQKINQLKSLDNE